MGKPHWIHGAIGHAGALHRELGIPVGTKIPVRRIESAEHSENPTLAARARLAETLRHLNHRRAPA